MGKTLGSSALLWASVLLAAIGTARSGKVVGQENPKIGDNITLTCLNNSEGSPPDSYLWIKDKKNLTTTKDKSLILYNITPDDQGEYACQGVYNGTLHTISSHLRLTPIIKPRLTIERGPDTDIIEGSEMILSCQVLNSPMPRVISFIWTFNDQKIVGEKNANLTFEQVHRTNSGNYICSSLGNKSLTVDPDGAKASINVQVQYLDSHVTLEPADWKTVLAGERVNFTCKADSFPTANLTWLRGDRILRTVESNEDVLSFHAKCFDDSGKYECRARNDLIQRSPLAQTELTVECPPKLMGNSSSPSQVSGYVGDNVTLSVWVTGHPAPSFQWSGPGLSSPSPQSPSVTLVSLRTHQAGRYTVTASNKHGSLQHVFLLSVLGQEHQPPGSSRTSMKLVLGILGGILLVLSGVAIVCFILNRRQSLQREPQVSQENRQELGRMAYPAHVHPPMAGHSWWDTSSQSDTNTLPRPHFNLMPPASSTCDSGFPLIPSAPFDEVILKEISASEAEEEDSTGPKRPRAAGTRRPLRPRGTAAAGAGRTPRTRRT